MRVHSTVLHVTDYIQDTTWYNRKDFFPYGQLNEEAQKANNKSFKRYRELFTRKISHQQTNEDVGTQSVIDFIGSTQPKFASTIDAEIKMRCRCGAIVRNSGF